MRLFDERITKGRLNNQCHHSARVLHDGDDAYLAMMQMSAHGHISYEFRTVHHIRQIPTKEETTFTRTRLGDVDRLTRDRRSFPVFPVP